MPTIALLNFAKTPQFTGTFLNCFMTKMTSQVYNPDAFKISMRLRHPNRITRPVP